MILNCMESEITSRMGSALFGPIGPEEDRTGPLSKPRTLGIGWLLYAFVRAVVPRVIVEVGSGGSTGCLAWGLYHNGVVGGRQGHLYTCDVFASGENDAYHREDYLKEEGGQPMNHNKAQLLRSLDAWNFRDFVTVLHKSNADLFREWEVPIDMLVIDDDHSEASARITVEFMKKWLLPSGYAFFHDYTVGYYTVGPSIRELVSSNDDWSMMVEPNMLSFAILQRKFSLDSAYCHYAWRLSQTDNPNAAKTWANMNNPRVWEILKEWRGELMPKSQEEYHSYQKEGVEMAEEQIRKESGK